MSDDPGKRVCAWVPTKVWKAATLAAADRDETLGAFVHDAIKAAAEEWERHRSAVWEKCLCDTIASVADRERFKRRHPRPRTWSQQQRMQIELWDRAGLYRDGEKETVLARLVE